MGLANLVPGISGGTMLLAAGVYRRFVDAVARITTFRWSVESILTLVIIVAGAGGAIVLGAGFIRGRPRCRRRPSLAACRCCGDCFGHLRLRQLPDSSAESCS